MVKMMDFFLFIDLKCFYYLVGQFTHFGKIASVTLVAFTQL